MNQTPVNRTALLTVAMISSFINPLMGSAVNVALPRIAGSFSLDAVAMSWVTMAYLLSSAVFLVPMGRLADIRGRKKMFLAGNLVFMPATLLCGLAFSGPVFITARFLQGLGSAMMFSTGLAMVISAFPPRERGRVIGLNVAAVYTGLSAAPIIGGVLTQAFGWRSLFFLNAGVNTVVIVLIIMFIKAEWTEAAGERFDLKGSLLYVPSMAALMYGLSRLPALSAVALAVAGACGMLLFAVVEYRTASPVLHLKLFLENREFSGANLTAFINYGATFAVGFMLSLYLQYAGHLNPRQAGMVLITQPVLMAVVAVLAGRLADRIAPRRLATAGMAVSTVGLFLLSFIGADTSRTGIIGALAVLGFGFGLFSAPNTSLVMGSVERRFYGVASATVSTMRSTGMMFSMAVATMVIHVFIGRSSIGDGNIAAFIGSTRTVFMIFTGLCAAGTALSCIGKRPAPPADARSIVD